MWTVFQTRALSPEPLLKLHVAVLMMFVLKVTVAALYILFEWLIIVLAVAPDRLPVNRPARRGAMTSRWWRMKGSCLTLWCPNTALLSAQWAYDLPVISLDPSCSWFEPWRCFTKDQNTPGSQSFKYVRTLYKTGFRFSCGEMYYLIRTLGMNLLITKMRTSPAAIGGMIVVT